MLKSPNSKPCSKMLPLKRNTMNKWWEISDNNWIKTTSLCLQCPKIWPIRKANTMPRSKNADWNWAATFPNWRKLRENACCWLPRARIQSSCSMPPRVLRWPCSKISRRANSRRLRRRPRSENSRDRLSSLTLRWTTSIARWKLLSKILTRLLHSTSRLCAPCKATWNTKDNSSWMKKTRWAFSSHSSPSCRKTWRIILSTSRSSRSKFAKRHFQSRRLPGSLSKLSRLYPKLMSRSPPKIANSWSWTESSTTSQWPRWAQNLPRRYRRNRKMWSWKNMPSNKLRVKRPLV